ncbi:MAG: hypothetical protein JXR63_12120 [Spirochaetales bacterium]|nr:hypothetical protein [Spirochaetales bacterium]
MRKFIFAVLAMAITSAAFAVEFPGAKIGGVNAGVDGDGVVFETEVIASSISVTGSSSFLNKITGETYSTSGAELFYLVIDGKRISSSELDFRGDFDLVRLSGNKGSAKSSDRFDGYAALATFDDPQGRFVVLWKAVARDYSSYVRQIVTIDFLVDNVKLEKVGGWLISADEASLAGSVDGVPVVTDDLFYACEAPMSIMSFSDDLMMAEFPRATVFNSDELFSATFVVGVAEPNHFRRSFNYYLENERAHAYRQNLHYNSWYDLCWGDSLGMSEGSYLERIHTIGKALTSRGVKVDGFLADDGWDDFDELWAFNDRFPNGFIPHKDAAREYGAGLGVWVSPWGGYAEQQQKRLQAAKKYGYEMNENGFSLEGAKYRQRFYDICSNMIETSGVNSFKFDGVGNGNGSAGADIFEKDIDGLLFVIAKLRENYPDLFINATVGTWPSPFWLMHADSIWRAGGDSTSTRYREEWVTYRDDQLHQNVVKRSPLFPVSSVMVHGILNAQYGYPAKFDMKSQGFKNEVRSYFAGGYNLRELYITPSMMSDEFWDYLAEAAIWAQNYSDVMHDSHWLGGSPSKREIYGFAAFENGKGYIALRNSSVLGIKKKINLELDEVLDLVDSDVELVIESAYADIEFRQEVSGDDDLEIGLRGREVLILNVRVK